MRNSSKILIVVVVIVATFSLGTVGGYLLFKEKYVSNKDNTQINNDKGNKSNKEEDLSLDNDIIKELFDRKTNFHYGKKVTYNDLSNQAKMKNDLINVTRKSFDNLDYDKQCELILKLNYDDKQELYNQCMSTLKQEDSPYSLSYFEVDDIKNNNLKYFNDSENLPSSFEFHNCNSSGLDLSPVGNIFLVPNSNYYLVSSSEGGAGGCPKEKSIFLKAQKTNDELVIYDKFAYMTLEDSVDYDSTSINLYGTHIDTDNSWFGENSDFLGTFIVSNFDDFSDDVIKIMKTYKHIYKLNDSGKYYWVSSEPVNNIE